MAIESRESAVNRNPWLDQPYQGARMPAGDWMVAYRNALPKTTPNPPLDPFVFAHGAKFNWDIWHKTGALDHLRDAGHRTLGIDLPPLGNFGNTRTTGPAMTNPSEFWQTTLDSFGIDKAIGVVHSQSGPDLAYPVLRDCPDTLAGLVLIAPIDTIELPERSDVPTLIVWSKNDAVAPPENARLLSEQFTNVTTVVMDGCGTVANGDPMNHAPYISRAEDTNQLFEWFGHDPASASQRIGTISMAGADVRGVVPSSGRA